MRWVPLILVALAAAIPLRAYAHHAADAAAHAGAPPALGGESLSAPSPKQRAAQLFFSDRELVTQKGERVAFYTDVLRDKVVLVNFIYTQCTDSCPTQTARVAAVQSLLPDAASLGIELVSISVDPEHDTPRALGEYAARFGSRDGWTFLTGSKANVDDVLRRLGQLAPSREAHTTLFMLGNMKSGHWIKLHPDSDPAEIARYLRLLAAESNATASR